MSKKSSTLIIIILLIIVGIVAYLIYTYGSDGKNSNKVNEITNTAVNNVVENKVTENKEENKKENVEVANSINQENQSTEVVTEDEREIAMNIAKEAWGDTDGVYFQMEGNQRADGEYIVSVSADAKVLAWYYVNASSRTYTVEYN